MGGAAGLGRGCSGGSPAASGGKETAARQQVEAEAAAAAAMAEQQGISEAARPRAELTVNIIRLGDPDVDTHRLSARIHP